MRKSILSISIIAVSLSLSCNQGGENRKQVAKREIEKKKVEATGFIIDTISFEAKKFKTGGFTSISKIPRGFKAITDTAEINFLIPFQKSLYSITPSIPLQKLKNDSFFHEILVADYLMVTKNGDKEDPYIQVISQNKFTFHNHNIKGYGSIYVGIVSTVWSNSNQDKCAIIINNEKREVSIWNYDDIKFTLDGNIQVLFRLKDRRTWYSYQYDSKTGMFVPIANIFYIQNLGNN